MRFLILAGGSGTRFWPVSRALRPKQFLSFDADRSLLQQTVDRIAPVAGVEAIWISTTEALATEVRQEVPDVPPGQILSEPVGRNTAPAIGWAVRSLPRPLRDSVVVVLPSDHRVADGAAFRSILVAAAQVAHHEDRVVTLGVRPSRPETGYGYLQQGESLAGPDGLRRVLRFTEKPAKEEARAFVESGDYLWNAGIFVFRGTTLLRHLERFEPAIAEGLERIADHPERLAEIYAELPSISIDYAVMERLDDIVTLPLDCGWSDLGSWESVAELLERDELGNALQGDTLAVEAERNLLVAEDGTVVVLGVSDLLVVTSGGAVLVAPRSRAQEIRKVVDALRDRMRDDLL
ncbi:MAG: mannose-1-phosphate guanylyltransferase [Thermoanaerobaculia bacterium]